MGSCFSQSGFALAFQPLHVGHDGFSVDLGVHHRPGEALQNDDHHIGPQRVEHPLGGTRCRTVAPQGVELRGPRLFVEEGVFAGIVGTIAETGQERDVCFYAVWTCANIAR